MKRSLRKSIIIALSAVFILGSLGLGYYNSRAYAVDGDRSGPSDQGQTAQTSGRQQSCDVREARVEAIMNRMANRGQRQIELFSTIATRVETFYTDKQLSVSNYEDLIADISTKKIAAQAAVDDLKDAIPDFQCDTSMTRGAIANFKDEHKAMREALKAFKTAVKDLIVAVKTAQAGTGEGQD